MTTHLIGNLLEVKPSEYTDKKTGKVSYGTDITVMFDGFDEQGYRSVSVETVNVDEEYHDILAPLIGQYVAIAYIIKVDQWGTKAYPDKSMPVMTLEKNPLDYTKFKRTTDNTAKKS
jgi:hypothetical protein